MQIKLANKSFNILELKGVILSKVNYEREVVVSMRSIAFKPCIWEQNAKSPLFHPSDRVTLFYLETLKNDNIIFVYNNTKQLSKKYYDSRKLIDSLNIQISEAELAQRLDRFIQGYFKKMFF